jgi:hypothetical protein
MLLLAVSHDAMLLDYLSQDSLWVFDGPPPANILELWEDDDSKGDELWPQQIKDMLAPADQGPSRSRPQQIKDMLAKDPRTLREVSGNCRNCPS